jgi:hypothetical protein
MMRLIVSTAGPYGLGAEPASKSRTKPTGRQIHGI